MELSAERRAMAMAIANAYLRRLPRSVQREDVMQAALIGLWDGMRRNPGEGPQYECYLRMRIRGAIVDELRAQDWLPRRHRSAEEARALAEQSPALRVVHLEEDATWSEHTPGAEPSPEDESIRRREMAEVYRALAHMPGIDQKIIRLHFLQGKKQKDIGEDFGISEARVSQRTTRTLQRMRDRLTA